MEQYIGSDVSLKDTFISVREGGRRIWRGKCVSDPAVIAGVIRIHAPSVRRVVFETGPLSVWFFHALTAQGVPAICIDEQAADRLSTLKRAMPVAHVDTWYRRGNSIVLYCSN